jgi:hypothetical protein
MTLRRRTAVPPVTPDTFIPEQRHAVTSDKTPDSIADGPG